MSFVKKQNFCFCPVDQEVKCDQLTCPRSLVHICIPNILWQLDKTSWKYSIVFTLVQEVSSSFPYVEFSLPSCYRNLKSSFLLTISHYNYDVLSQAYSGGKTDKHIM